MSSNGAHHRDRTIHPGDVDVQCWCGARIVWMPLADYNAGVLPSCEPQCTTLAPLSREQRSTA